MKPEFNMSEAKEYANTILAQMGGVCKLIAMVGACDFICENDPQPALKFRFKASKKCNVCRVAYDYAKDLYNVEFYRLRAGKLTLVHQSNGAYNEDLIKIFESTTGCYLSF